MVIPAPARRAFGAVQAVSQPLAARLAEHWFFTPPRDRVRGEAAKFLRSGRRFSITVDGRAVIGWEWGAGKGPVVYLVHGWGSSGGRLGAFAQPLIAMGYQVVTFDAPGHGASGRGRSSMPEFARALRAVADRYATPRAVIAHSLGGSAAALAAAWGLQAERFALLAASAAPAAFAEAFASSLGAREDVMERARANSERRLRFSWSELDVCAVAQRMTAPALVVHDEGDEVVPFEEGAAIAASWPGARLLPTSGLGHRGVVRDPGVVSEVVRFVADSATAPRPMSMAEQVEYELFYRDSRWR